ncbi:MAG: site-2 protease family protein [Oscillospiraceae bacterium]
MVNSLMGSGDIFLKLLNLFAYVVAILISLPFHEFAHAFIADKLGDKTARYQGRLTLNPFAHLDLWGSLMLFLFGFGYAKPVPVNPYNFKNAKTGMALTSFAGPVSNVILAIFFMIIHKILSYSGIYLTAFGGLEIIISTIIIINMSLAIFNLLPIPPLDGSRIASLFLPERIYFKIMQYERIIMIILFAVLAFTSFLDVPLSYLQNGLLAFINFITGFVDMIFGYSWAGL